MATVTTYTHSITLNPGESFTLPSNSKILFTTDNSGLESVCADLPDENLACFGFVAFAQIPNDDGQKDIIEADDVLIVGVEFNGIRYDFPTPKGVADTVGVYEQLDLLGYGLMMVNKQNVFSLEFPRESVKNIFQFQTLPSIANKLRIIAQGPVPDPDAIAGAYYYFPVITYQELVDQQHSNLNECTLS